MAKNSSGKFHTTGRGGPQSAGKTRAAVTKARTGTTNRGSAGPRRLGGGSPLNSETVSTSVRKGGKAR